MPDTTRKVSSLRRLAATALAGTCLLTSPPAVAEDQDLDQLADEKLRAALEAELDDVLADETPPNDNEQLIAAFEAALGDDNDDADEAVISWSELEHEMAEIGTTVHAVVAQAVNEAIPKPPETHDPEATSADAHSLGAAGGEPQSLGRDRIRKAYNKVLASLFSAIDKKG